MMRGWCVAQSLLTWTASLHSFGMDYGNRVSGSEKNTIKWSYTPNEAHLLVPLLHAGTEDAVDKNKLAVSLRAWYFVNYSGDLDDDLTAADHPDRNGSLILCWKPVSKWCKEPGSWAHGAVCPQTRTGGEWMDGPFVKQHSFSRNV